MKVGDNSLNRKSSNLFGAFTISFLHSSLLLIFIALLSWQCGIKSEKISAISSLIESANAVHDSTFLLQDAAFSGTVYFFNFYGKMSQQAEYKEYLKYPDKIRIDFDYGDMLISNAFDGVFAMKRVGQRKAERINANRFLTKLRVLSFPDKFLNQSYKFTLLPDASVDDDSCYVLSGRYPSHEIAKFFIERERGVIRRYEGRSHFGQMGRLVIEYGDYKQIQKRWFPFLITYYLNNRMYKIIEIERIECNKGLDDLQFDLDKKLILI